MTDSTAPPGGRPVAPVEPPPRPALPGSDAAAVPGRRHPLPRPVPTFLSAADGVFLLLGAVTAGWLAYLTLRRLFTGGLEDWWLLLVLWVLLAYLLLPRVHTLLARVYVPDYFIGRTRTYEGLLGDPINVALLSTADQLHTAMTRGGWQLADELGFRSGLRIITSTLTRRTYPTAPVSPLFLFGRLQDLTYQQEVEGNPARRHHVRFWRTPPGWFLPGGARVDWLAAGTYDRALGLSAFTLQVTHKIDQDVDAERDHIVATVLAGTPQAEVSVIRHFSSGYHSRNGGGDAIRTDGDLPVLDLTRVTADGHADVVAPHHGLRDALAAPARTLLETVTDTGSSNRTKRPLTLYTGYGMVLARAVVAAGTAVAAALAPRGSDAPAWVPPLPASPEQVVLVLAGAALAITAYAAVGQLTFGGHPVARLVALALSVAGIVAALVVGPADAAGWGSRLWLTNLALDVGILLTLSSGDVRDFHLRRTAERRAGPAPAGGPHARDRGGVGTA